MRRASLILSLFLAGCFGCEAETKPDPDERQVVAAWVMQIGNEKEIVAVTAPTKAGPITVRVNYLNGKR